MTKYHNDGTQARIHELLTTANELAGVTIEPATAVSNAAELAVTFHRLSREMARYGALQWAAKPLPTDALDTEACPRESLADADEDVSNSSETPSEVQSVNSSRALESEFSTPGSPRVRDVTKAAETLRRTWENNSAEIPGTAQEETKRRVDLSVLKSLADNLGPSPSHLRGRTPLVRELDAVDTFRQADLALVAGVESEWLHVALTAFAARLKALQSANEWTALLPTHHARAEQIHHAIAGMARRTQCGVVHGLALAHEPAGESWLDDARDATARFRECAGLPVTSAPTRPRTSAQQLLNELAELAPFSLNPDEFIEKARHLMELGVRSDDGKLVRAASLFVPDLMDVPGMSDLRRNATRFLNDQEDSEPSYTIERDWPLLQQTRGMNVVLVGGDPRNDREAVIGREFEFGSCHWEHFAEGTGKNRLASLCERVRRGGVDMVIVLSAFCSHTISDRMFELKGDTRVILSRTYGIRQIQAAIERFLQESTGEPDQAD